MQGVRLAVVLPPGSRRCAFVPRSESRSAVRIKVLDVLSFVLLINRQFYEVCVPWLAGAPGASGVRMRLALEALHGPHWALRASGHLPGTWDLTHSFVAGFLNRLCLFLPCWFTHPSIYSMVSSARPVLGSEVWLSSQEGTVPVLL